MSQHNLADTKTEPRRTIRACLKLWGATFAVALIGHYWLPSDSDAVAVVACATVALLATPFYRAWEPTAGTSAPPAQRLSLPDSQAKATLWITADGKIDDANESACHLLGYARDELLQMNIRGIECCPPLNQWSAPHGSDPSTFESKLRTKGGAVVAVEVMIGTMAASGKESTRAVMRPARQREFARKLHTDITLLEKSNRELEARVVDLQNRQAGLQSLCSDAVHQASELARSIDVAESASRLKGEFLASMSHEIRTPMTAILGFIDLLLDPHSTESDKRDAINTIKRNGQHLLVLINDILDLSKMEARKLDIERITCHPRQIMIDVRDLLSEQAASQGLRLEFEIAGEVPNTIVSDPTRIRQALINLTGNAIKFSERGTVNVTACCNRQTETLAFSVSDQGIGMTDEQMASLFTPFGQADTTIARRFGGTGLGLSITKRLAELLGGEVKVWSKLGHGSTFTLTISTGPLDKVEMITCLGRSPTVHHQETTPLPHLTGRVLVVEDSADNQRLISFILKKAGAEVVLADNGQVGMDLAIDAASHGSPFGIILMDMQMPVMDGYTATAKLRSEGYSGQIVALTAHAMKDEYDKCLVAGCDHYLSKPIQRNVLISEIAARMGKPSEQPRATDPPSLCHATQCQPRD